MQLPINISKHYITESKWRPGVNIVHEYDPTVMTNAFTKSLEKLQKGNIKITKTGTCT